MLNVKNLLRIVIAKRWIATTNLSPDHKVKKQTVVLCGNAKATKTHPTSSLFMVRKVLPFELVILKSLIQKVNKDKY